MAIKEGIFEIFLRIFELKYARIEQRKNGGLDGI